MVMLYNSLENTGAVQQLRRRMSTYGYYSTE